MLQRQSCQSWRLMALVLLLGTVARAMPSTYQCSGNVVCASNAPPGGLTVAQTPQIIVLSHDDAITVSSNKYVRAVVNQFANPNGCNVPFTWFVSGGSGTNCAIARRLLADNHEIATHTLAHSQLVPGTVNITDQIARQRAFLNDTCGIPLEKMIGFRAPYLLHNPETRQALENLGFLYDSSIIESWPSLTSPSSHQRVYPYSMAAGIPQSCQWMAPATCNTAERYPNLFEIPMLQFEATNGTMLSSMDPTAMSGEALLAQLLEQFDFSYEGNRAPFGVYVHTSWFAAKPYHAEALAAFIRTVQAKPDVYFLTFSQLRSWMMNPVPASEMASWFSCNPVDFSAEELAPCTTYTVKEGDTFFSIIDSKEILLSDLLALNPSLATNAAIYVGQRLWLTWDASCPDALASQPPCRNYTVASGDALYNVAQSFSLTVDDIVAVNKDTGLTPMSTLRIGQTVKLPPWPVVECFYGNATTPSPAPAAPAPAPAMAEDDDIAPVVPACGTEAMELDLVVTGFDAQTFTDIQPQFKAGLAALLRVPAACIAVARSIDVAITATGQRRLMSERSLLADAQVLVQLTIGTSNATQTAAYLAGAQQLGSLATVLNLLGGQLNKVTAASFDSQGNIIPMAASAPAPAPTVSESPATSVTPTQPIQTTEPVTVSQAAAAPAIKKSSSKVGAIVGGAVGGGVGALLCVALIVFLLRRRQRLAATDSGGLRSSYAVQNPVYAGASAQLSTVAPSAKDRFELEQVIESTGTPRSARRRAVTAFNNNENGAM